jgi:1-acyl-sn-glycerol-3-phosphate acyltransferase
MSAIVRNRRAVPERTLSKILETCLITDDSSRPNQFRLLRERRFGPFFVVQLLGAANDNLFKFAFTVMVAYGGIQSGLAPAIVVQLIAALFILPFLLLSATSGQLADKMDKARLMRWVKTFEIGIALLGLYGFVNTSVVPLLVGVFALGVHSSVFGPVKYAYLPQHLTERELTGGNGMVEMGTFVAILLGNVAGGLLIAVPEVGAEIVGWCCVALAVVGRVAAHFVPSTPPSDPGLRINWNPVTETWRNLALARESKVVFRSLLGISWMWFFGAVFLTQFPSFAKDVLGGSEQVASLLLVIFSIGIAIGSLLCESLSRRQVEIGLVPFGAIAMSVFAIDLYFASRGFHPASSGLSVGGFFGTPGSIRVSIDLFLLSLAAGLYSVPMYALIQIRSKPSHRSRIIAANNILNSLFMIVSAGMAAVLLSLDFTVPQLFLITGVLNALVAAYVFVLVPEYLLRFLAFIVSHLMYRFRVRGAEHVPAEGAAVLICNHVSFVDAILILSASPRPIVFIMDRAIFAAPMIGWVFRLAKAVPIASRAEDPLVYENAFKRGCEALSRGELVCVFPEGGLTRDGALAEFRTGVLKLLKACPAPVIPMALNGLWGSVFSRARRSGASRPPRLGFFPPVTLTVGRALPPGVPDMPTMRAAVVDLSMSEVA